jgi:hypothetical protein
MATSPEQSKASRLRRKIKLAALDQVRDNLFYYGSLSEEQQEQISEQFKGIITEYESGMEAAEESLLADVDASIRDVVQNYGYDVALAAIGDNAFSFVAYNPDLRKMVDENLEFGYQNITGQTQEEDADGGPSWCDRNCGRVGERAVPRSRRQRRRGI